jgi:hypothetical protein
MGKAKTTAKAKKPAKKAPATKRDKHTIDLGALDAERYGRRPDLSVAKQVHGVKALAAHAKKHATALVAGSRLERADITELEARLALLDTAETAWLSLRKRSAPKEITRARDAAVKLRSSAIRALRYFVADDAEVQLRLNAVQEGDGDVDLIDDLRQAAALLDEHAEALAKDKRLPKERGDALRTAALELEAGVLDRDTSPEAREARDRRNRAFWWLQDLVSKVRAAGQYVFDDDPATYALFVDVLRRNRARSKAEGAPGEEKK